MNTFVGHVSVYILSVIYFTIKYLFGQSLQREKFDSRLDNVLKEITKGSIIHRGGIPENTVIAFHRSKLGGAKAVEVDLQFSKDGHPVLFHDWTVDRVSNGSGHLHDMTLKEIQSLHITDSFNFGRHNFHTVPTLYEAIEALKKLDMYMFLELKDLGKQTVPTILHLFEVDAFLYDRVIIITFFPHIIYKIRQKDPNIIIGLIMKNKFLTKKKSTNVTDVSVNRCCHYSWQLLLILWNIIERITWSLLTSCVWKVIGINLLLPDKDEILENRFNVDYFQRKCGMTLITWTVNSSHEKEYFDSVLRIPYMSDFTSQL